MSTFAAIKTALPMLSLAERQELMLLLQFLGTGQGVNEAPGTDFDSDDWFAEGVERLLVKRGLATSRGVRKQMYHALEKLPKYVIECRAVRSFFREAFGFMPTRPQLVRFADIAVGALAMAVERSGPSKDLMFVLDKHGVPPDVINKVARMGSSEISARRLLASVGRLPGAVDWELPGYLGSGLIKLIIGEPHGKTRK